MNTTSARRAAPSALALLLLAPPLFAQDDPHAACAMPPSYVPAELLERPIARKTGTGNSHERVTTDAQEAQAFYDQGLDYLESYVWIEASRSFHQALRADPQLAMAFLGLSYVHSGLENPEAAKRFLARAEELAPRCSERERRRIEIRAKQLAAMDDVQDPARFLAYKKAIDDALSADLDDPVLWVLRGNAEEGNAFGRGQRGTAGSVAFYQQVLRLVPNHATAHHYLVHSYETIGRIDHALAHGAVFAREAPAIPHAAHMWGHDLRRVGRVDEAVAQFQKALALERDYYAAEGIDPALDWHHGHNLDLLASCYEHQGQMRLAEETLRASAALAPVNAYRAFNLRELPSFLLHGGRFEEALAEARALTETSYASARSVGHALAGQALLALGRIDAAKDELAAAQRELDTLPVVPQGFDPSRGSVEPWVSALRGELLLRTGDPAAGSEVLRAVVRALRAAPGPDAWSLGLFRMESLAHSAIAAKAWELAEFIAAEMLEHDAAYGGGHFTMARVLRQKGDADGARRELEAARRCWSDADESVLALVESELR